MSKNRKKLIFLKPLNASFILNDIRMLENHFDVSIIEVGVKTGIMFFFNQTLVSIKMLYHLRQGSCLFIWFADYYTWHLILMARLLQRPSYLVIGGFESANLPEIGYGGLINPVRRFLVTRSIMNANYVLPVHMSLVDRLPDSVRIKGHVREVATGWSGEVWYRGTTEKKNQVICVADVTSYQRIVIKGLVRFMEVAARLPELDFVLIGVSEEASSLLSMPANVTSIVFMKDIREFYAESKVYLQLSITEGLPNVLGEAMLCECICVATDVGGTRDIVGKTGYIIEQSDSEYVAGVVKNAIAQYSIEKGKAARQRIIEKFSPQQREEILLDLFKAESILP